MRVKIYRYINESHAVILHSSRQGDVTRLQGFENVAMVYIHIYILKNIYTYVMLIDNHIDAYVVRCNATQFQYHKALDHI